MDEAQLLGILGNLIASFLWNTGKWVSKPLLDKLPDLATMLASGGEKQNHDLLRALRRAECRTVVALCDCTLREDFHFNPDSGWISRLSARWRAGQDLEMQDLVYLRRVFARRYEALALLPTAELLGLHGAAVTDAQALIAAGGECFAVADQDTLREQVVQRQIAALDRTVRTLPEATDAQALELRHLAFNGLPPSLTRHMQQHPEGWWDLLRLAFREELSAAGTAHRGVSTIRASAGD